MSERKYRFLISGGGTGGHIFPAIAIAREIQKKYPEAEVEFVGAKDKMEMRVVPDAGFRIHGLWISGIQRRLTAKNLSFPFKLLSSLMRSRSILKKFKPDAVIGVGGFASGPLLYMASRMKIPTLIQEQNSYPGITNKLLAGRVNRICVAFEGLERFFPKEKIVSTGNPVRSDIVENKITKEEARNKLGLDPALNTVLIIGGSLGAKTINQAIEAGLDKLEEANIQILWQTGRSYTGDAEVKLGKRVTFIKEMDLAYASADAVISRAGALSISELCLVGKPTIFVPSPNVAEDHQTKNARSLVDHDAALLVKDSEAGQQLIDRLLALMKDSKLREDLSARISELGKPNATEHIVQEIMKLID